MAPGEYSYEGANPRSPGATATGFAPGPYVRMMGHESPTQSTDDLTHDPYSFSHRPSSLHSRNSSQRGLMLDTQDLGGSNSKERYAGFSAVDMLEPGTPDEMHKMGKPPPRQGASRYIVEGGSLTPFTLWSSRGWLNMGGIFLLAAGLITLFAGYPIISYFSTHTVSDLIASFPSGPGAGPTNLSNMTEIPGARRALIDVDTPTNVYNRTGYDGFEYDLVFSDEFNVDGRTFWPGDDPFFEAVDFNYWATGDLEWYDPDSAITANGSLVITISEAAAAVNHNLDYRSSMLQSWNKMCFTGGYIETSTSLPGSNSVGGFWPAFWTMGNLGRAGYGATTEGMWPYTYNHCDLGAMPNQTDPATGAPGQTALSSGDPGKQGDLSWLPGMKLGRCTCSGEDHPGPHNPDGSFMGRSSPEIDVFEIYAEEATRLGMSSQTVQVAPYDDRYLWTNQTGTFELYPDSGFHTALNSYHGGALQQSVSSLSRVPTNSFELAGTAYATHGFEYRPQYMGNDEAFITWMQDDKPTWTLNQTGLAANPRSQVSQRDIPNEPMYMIMNLGLSASFVPVNVAELRFPAHMKFDYIRIYQRKGEVNIGCDPEAYPTLDYITKHAAAYNNANLTTWAQSSQLWPKNSMQDGCSQP